MEWARLLRSSVSWTEWHDSAHSGGPCEHVGSCTKFKESLTNFDSHSDELEWTWSCPSASGRVRSRRVAWGLRFHDMEPGIEHPSEGLADLDGDRRPDRLCPGLYFLERRRTQPDVGVPLYFSVFCLACVLVGRSRGTRRRGGREPRLSDRLSLWFSSAQLRSSRSRLDFAVLDRHQRLDPAGLPLVALQAVGPAPTQGEARAWRRPVSWRSSSSWRRPRSGRRTRSRLESSFPMASYSSRGWTASSTPSKSGRSAMRPGPSRWAIRGWRASPCGSTTTAVTSQPRCSRGRRGRRPSWPTRASRSRSAWCSRALPLTP